MHSPQPQRILLVEPKKEKEVLASEKGKLNLLVPEKERSDIVDPEAPPSTEDPLQDPEKIPPLRILGPENEDAAYVCNKLVVYQPEHNQPTQVSPTSESTVCETHNCDRSSGRFIPQKILPDIGTFTVQCAMCLKWRIIPTKEEYEAIRETIIEEPFICEYAKKWRPDISCDDPHDLEPDDSKIWAIDKPNISQPPPGWQRLLRIRSEGSSKFADVYYVAPTGKRLRSMVEVQKFLLSHPEYMEAVNPLAWATPPSYSELRDSVTPTSCVDNDSHPPQKKRARPQLG